MLHTKCQGYRPFGSGEEDFLRFLPCMGMAAILVMWPGLCEQTFVPSSHGDSLWNLASICPVVSEEKMFKECGRQTDDRQTDGRRRPTYPISSPMSPSVCPVVSEEKMFKECGGQTDDRQTDGRRRPTYPISSPMSLRLRWAKKVYTSCILQRKNQLQMWNLYHCFHSIFISVWFTNVRTH